MFLAMEMHVFVIWVITVLVQMHMYGSCIDKERRGLLEIKANLISVPSDTVIVLRGWTNETENDCCHWERIKCHNISRRVIGIDLSHLMYYQNPNPYLNLSYMYPFEELRSLNLSGNQLDGLFNDMEGYKSLGRFTRLETLDLSFNRFNKSVLPFLSAASSLTSLILRENFVSGIFPMKELKNFGNLTLLDLSQNLFNGPLPGEELSNLHKLEVLDLSDNDFSGSLESQGICTLKNLRELDLSNNSFAGSLSLCFGSLTKLQVLDIASNQLSGELPPPAISGLQSLEYLSLTDNNFEGSFSLSLITNFSKLKVFKLSSRSNKFQVVTDPHWQPEFQLNALRLSHCNLEEIPNFLMNQKELLKLDLSNNRLSGTFPTWLLENIQNLEVLILQNNSFSILQLPRQAHKLQVLDVSANSFGGQLSEDIGRILPGIMHLNLSRNKFQGNLPPYLGEMRSIYILDISHNNFSGSLAGSFFTSCHSLRILKLSHNKFTGQVFPKDFSNLSSLTVLNADNNMFTGNIGDGLLSSLVVLDISDNYLTGAIPSWMGNLSVLSISHNLLEGTLPASLFNSSKLRFLDLSGNMLSGRLPSHVNAGFWNAVLYLQNNVLSGHIPDTFLENVGILDLRDNKLSGNIPRFVNTQNISILLLRGNHLTGPIPDNVCELSNLRLLDLSHNGLNGSIPSCLDNVSFGLRGYQEDLDPLLQPMFPYIDGTLENHYTSLLVPNDFAPDYLYYLATLVIEIAFAAKHRYESYTNGNLAYMFGLDLSSNGLNGEIPEALGHLQKLRALNLSHNSLFGLIPESFSNLSDIESLDISFNRLYGRIPLQMTGLDNLAVFNVSYNNLSGDVPQGSHFSTFDGSSYLGNALLCGPPTNRSCNGNDLEGHDHVRQDGETAIDMEVFYWSLLGTYASVLLGFLVFMCFDSPWRRAWFRSVDSIIYWVKSL